MISERVAQIHKTNRETRARLDRRKEQIDVKDNRRKECRRSADDNPEALCCRVMLRALYASGNMLVFNALWAQKRHLFDGE